MLAQQTLHIATYCRHSLRLERAYCLLVVVSSYLVKGDGVNVEEHTRPCPTRFVVPNMSFVICLANTFTTQLDRIAILLHKESKQ